MPNINVLLPVEVFSALEQRAKKEGVKMSRVVRDALEKHLKVSGEVASPGRPWNNGVAKQAK